MARGPAYLLVLGDRKPLAWVLRTQRMAFGAHRAAMARRLRPGDELFLYTTRGCFHNPTLDRGRVIGVATVQATPTLLPEPVTFDGATFGWGCDLLIDGLARARDGVVLADLIEDLPATFSHPRTWSAAMRRPLVPVAPDDGRTIERHLRPLLHPRHEVVDGYEALAARALTGTARR